MKLLRRAAAHCAVICLILVSSPALAAPPDTEALLTRLDAMFAESGYVAEFGPVESSVPGDFRIAHINMTGRGYRTPARVENVTIAGADLADDGSLSIERLTIARVTQSGQDRRGREYTVDVGGAEVTGVYQPDSDNGEANLVPARRSEWKVGRITVTFDGAVALIIDEIRGSAEPDAARQTLRSTAELTRLRFDPYAFGDAKVARTAGELEVLSLDLSMEIAARWDAKSGRMAVETWRLDAPGLGALDFSAVIDGYSEERVRQMRSANVASAGNSGDGASAMHAAGREIMAALGAITIAEGTLRFKDRSLVRRVLEARAEADDKTVEELVELLPDLSLSYTQLLEMPEFSNMVADALRTFLRDPKSMTVRLRPSAPVPVAGMIAMALFSPAALIQQLGLEITAND